MSLPNQLNDVSSGSIPLLVLAQIATCLSYLRSMLFAFLQSLGLSRFPTDQIVVDDGLFATVGSGLAGLIMLSDQLAINKRLCYTYVATALDHGADADGCVVCQNAFKDGDQVRKLPCRHVFHRHCFDGWLQYKFNCPNCPLCRSSLISDERVAHTERRVGRELASWFSLR